MSGKIKKEQEEVFHRLLGGDDTAFDTLFRIFYPGLLRYAKSLIPYPSDEAEDIIAEVFCHLWQNKENVVIQTSVSAYLYKATKNRILNLLKKRKLTMAPTEGSAYEITDLYHQQPDQLMLYKEMDQRIVFLIGQLPERTRVIFLMSRDEGLTYEDIADLLGISINTVKTHMFRAIRFLKGAFRK